MRLCLLSGGTLDADRSVTHPGDDSHRRVILPIMQVLIETAGQRILVDTGLPPAAIGDTDGLKREFDMDRGWIRPLVAADEGLEAQLGLLDLRPSDVDLVINTHLHFDHAGQNALFAGVPIAIQEAELEAARASDDYLPIWDAPDLRFRAVRDDWSPAPGIEMLHTPGHTPGHQSMLVRLSERPWLFTGDAVYTEEHWRANLVGAVKDVAQARGSIERLRTITEREKARIIFGHDIAQWEALEKAPRYYE